MSYIDENRIPYADVEHMDDPETKAIVEAGFAIIGFYEDIGGCALDKYINSSIATKAIKL